MGTDHDHTTEHEHVDNRTTLKDMNEEQPRDDRERDRAHPERVDNVTTMKEMNTKN